MRFVRFWTVGFLLLTMAACAGRKTPPPRPADGPPAPPTPPGARVEALAGPADEDPAGLAATASRAPAESAPAAAEGPAWGWSGVAVRLEFAYPDRGFTIAGAGFVVRDREGCDYLLTSAHFLEGRAWHTRCSVTLKDMKGNRLAESFGSSLLVGTPADVAHREPGTMPDLTQDLVIRVVAGRWARPLPLAAADPVVGEPAWVVGREYGRPPGDDQLYPGQITGVGDGGYVLKKEYPFEAQGFSGGPVVNARGEVIGNVVAGNDTIVSGATVGTLRRRLAENGITVD